MESSHDLRELIERHNRQQFQDLLEAFNTVSEWVDKNFKEVQFSVEFNDDSQNPIKPQFKIKCRLFTGKDMDPSKEDQLLKFYEMSFTKEVWDDPVVMTKAIRLIPEKFKETITQEVNSWYQMKKQKAGLS